MCTELSKTERTIVLPNKRQVAVYKKLLSTLTFDLC